MMIRVISPLTLPNNPKKRQLLASTSKNLAFASDEHHFKALRERTVDRARELFKTGKKEEAYKLARTALEWTDPNTKDYFNVTSIVSHLNMLGLICAHTGKFDEGQHYLKRAQTLVDDVPKKFKSVIDKEVRVQTLMNFGWLHLHANQLEESQEAFTIALEKAEQFNSKQTQTAHLGLGEVTFRLGDYPSAKKHMVKALEHLNEEPAGDNWNLVRTQQILAHICSQDYLQDPSPKKLQETQNYLFYGIKDLMLHAQRHKAQEKHQQIADDYREMLMLLGEHEQAYFFDSHRERLNHPKTLNLWVDQFKAYYQDVA